jgi:hypothetical protein
MAATQTLMVPIRVRAPHGAGEVGSNKIRIELQAEDQPAAGQRKGGVPGAAPLIQTCPHPFRDRGNHANLIPQAGNAPWYRHRWPWLLMSGPAVVVVAGIFTAWLAISRADALVADDYYKQGKAINKDLRRDHEAQRLGAAIGIGYDPAAAVLRGRLQMREVPAAGEEGPDPDHQPGAPDPAGQGPHPDGASAADGNVLGTPGGDGTGALAPGGRRWQPCLAPARQLGVAATAQHRNECGGLRTGRIMR